VQVQETHHSHLLLRLRMLKLYFSFALTNYMELSTTREATRC
jgi:hypothetical protein